MVTAETSSEAVAHRNYPQGNDVITLQEPILSDVDIDNPAGGGQGGWGVVAGGDHKYLEEILEIAETENWGEAVKYQLSPNLRSSSGRYRQAEDPGFLPSTEAFGKEQHRTYLENFGPAGGPDREERLTIFDDAFRKCASVFGRDYVDAFLHWQAMQSSHREVAAYAFHDIQQWTGSEWAFDDRFAGVHVNGPREEQSNEGTPGYHQKTELVYHDRIEDQEEEVRSELGPVHVERGEQPERYFEWRDGDGWTWEDILEHRGWEDVWEESRSVAECLLPKHQRDLYAELRKDALRYHTAAHESMDDSPGWLHSASDHYFGKSFRLLYDPMPLSPEAYDTIERIFVDDCISTHDDHPENELVQNREHMYHLDLIILAETVGVDEVRIPWNDNQPHDPLNIDYGMNKATGVTA